MYWYMCFLDNSQSVLKNPNFCSLLPGARAGAGSGLKIPGAGAVANRPAPKPCRLNYCPVLNYYKVHRFFLSTNRIHSPPCLLVGQFQTNQQQCAILHGYWLVGSKPTNSNSLSSTTIGWPGPANHEKCAIFSTAIGWSVPHQPIELRYPQIGRQLEKNVGKMSG